MAKTAERDIVISEEIKNIIVDNTLWDRLGLKKELNARGLKGIGDKQILRCIRMAGFDCFSGFIGTCESIESKKKEIEKENRKGQKNKVKNSQKIYKHPDGSEEIYKNLLRHEIMPDLDKRAAVYCYCIDDICIYVGQSISLLRRIADHQYWIENESNDSPNNELYKLIKAAKDRNRKVSLIVFVMIDSQLDYNTKKATLNVYESEIIKSKLPIANKAIPNVFGEIERTQRLRVDDDNINEFFMPEFNERRDFLDADYRKDYSYIFNPYYDKKIKDRLYCYRFNMI